jgi:UDP-galactopyranose mutase
MSNRPPGVRPEATNGSSHAASAGSLPDLICFSHLRWDFVYQRPQHLLRRFARQRRVFFIEEPIFDVDVARVDVSFRQDSLWVVVPHLPAVASRANVDACVKDLINGLLAAHDIAEYVLWFYTPMAMEYTRELSPLAIVYDCMDELSSFKDAPPALKEQERRLLERADIVFTGGQSLYEAKRNLHSNVHAMPSSIDAAHFRQARGVIAEPGDQAAIPSPRLGFAGVIDERMDAALIEAVATANPHWHIVLVGPIVKIDPATLPRRPNIHYTGPRAYADLPAYMAGWDVALIPFALNESTRFISPTKTPEYLAAGRRVVSTAITDVMTPYGERGLVAIANSPQEFTSAIDAALAAARGKNHESWLDSVDAFLSQTSWDSTWDRMCQLLDAAVSTRKGRRRIKSHLQTATAAV